MTLTDATRPDAAMDRLRTRFPHILVLSFEPGNTVGDTRSYRARITGRADLAVAAGFVEHVRRLPVTDGERALLTAAFEAARGDDGCRPSGRTSRSGCGRHGGRGQGGQGHSGHGGRARRAGRTGTLAGAAVVATGMPADAGEAAVTVAG